jgi:type IV pilus assembly protein PilA
LIQKLQDMRNREDGFTLIELMVVVLIIAILIAIAIPTFLGARARAQDRAAQSSLRNSVTAAKAIFTDNEDYADATDAALAAGEPALVFKASAVPSTDQNMVSVNPGTTPSSRFVGAVLSKSDKCWFVQDVVSPGTNPGTKWAFNNAPAANSCTAASAPAVGTTAVPGPWVSNPGDAVDIP